MVVVFAKTLGKVLSVPGIFISSDVARSNVSLINCLHGCFLAILSAVFVLFLDDVVIVDVVASCSSLYLDDTSLTCSRLICS